MSDLKKIVTSDLHTTAFAVAMHDIEKIGSEIDCIDRGRIGMVDVLAKKVASDEPTQRVGWLNASPSDFDESSLSSLWDTDFLVTAIMTTEVLWQEQRPLIRELLDSIELAISYMRSSPDWASHKLSSLAKYIPDPAFASLFEDPKPVQGWIKAWCSDRSSVFNFSKGLTVSRPDIEKALDLRLKAWKFAVTLDHPQVCSSRVEEIEKQTQTIIKNSLPDEVTSQRPVELPKVSREWLLNAAKDTASSLSRQRYNTPTSLALAILSALLLAALALAINFPDDWPKAKWLDCIPKIRHAVWVDPALLKTFPGMVWPNDGWRRRGL